MRIITGKYKGRHFDIPRTFKARPTTDFAKENIFNVLVQYVDFEEATALDLFSGTGSISLELLSRGCQQVVSVELDRDHHRFIQDCLKKLHPTTSAISHQPSALSPQPSAISHQSHSRRRLPFCEVVPSAVRPHLCRPTIRAEGTAYPAQPHHGEGATEA